jgi:hypothetical protein
MSTAAVFLDIEKAFDTTGHNGLLLYKLSKMNFSASLIKLISSFLSNRKFSVSAEGKMYTPRIIKAGVPQGSVLSPTLFNMYINDMPQAIGAPLALFADDTCLYATDHKEGYVLRKLQRGLNSMVEWSKRWNIRIKEDKTQAIYFSHKIRLPETFLTIHGQNIHFLNNVKYLGVIFDRKLLGDYI